MKVIAITACPTGIAHTFMAAEALQIAAEELDYDIKVETQGAVGIENALNENDINFADAIIIASDREIDKSRFTEKKIFQVSTQDAIRDSKKVIEDALKYAKSLDDNHFIKKKYDKLLFSIYYKHFMTGISAMVPFLVAAAVLYVLAPLALMIGGSDGESFANAIKFIAEMAFKLSLPIFSAYIAYSLGSVPALTPGMIGGFVVSYLNGGFIGALLTGFLAGSVINILKKYVKVPKDIEGLSAIFILPTLSTFLTGIIYTMIFSRPLYVLHVALVNWGVNINSTASIIIGAILGGMMAYDMGGPVNKIAYVIGVASVATGGSSSIMAAVMVGGMVPPLVAGGTTIILKKVFRINESQKAKPAILKGFAFITEGAIPFASSNPRLIIPAMVSGSAVAGALSMLYNCKSLVPQGGIVAIVIPGLIQNPLLYLLALFTGVITSVVIILLLKLKFHGV